MKDNEDGKAQPETCATGYTGMTVDTAHQTCHTDKELLELVVAGPEGAG